MHDLEKYFNQRLKNLLEKGRHVVGKNLNSSCDELWIRGCSLGTLEKLTRRLGYEIVIRRRKK
jgi:hypothetical protein